MNGIIEEHNSVYLHNFYSLHPTQRLMELYLPTINKSQYTVQFLLHK